MPGNHDCFLLTEKIAAAELAPGVAPDPAAMELEGKTLLPSIVLSLRKAFCFNLFNIVFTGHEHQSDYHLTQNIDGNNIAYVEGNGLQQLDHPARSGFNCLLRDFSKYKQCYFLFRWNTDRYTAVVDGAEHPLRIIPKNGSIFDSTNDT